MGDLQKLEDSIEQKKKTLEECETRKKTRVEEEEEKPNLFKPVLQSKRRSSWKTAPAKQAGS